MPWHPSAFLLAAQLVSLGLYALINRSNGGRALLSAFGLLVLALAIWVIRRSPSFRWFAWLLVTPAFILSLLSAIFDHPGLLAWSSMMEAVVFFYCTGSQI
jgi:hypothetical protein